MLASDLAMSPPTVRADDSYLVVSRRIVEQGLPGVIVVDDNDRPIATLTATTVAGAALGPIYFFGPGLVRAVDEPHAEQAWRERVGLRVSDCLSMSSARPAQVSREATVVEVVVVMVRHNTPLVALVDERGRVEGAVTAAAVLAQIATAESDR